MDDCLTGASIIEKAQELQQELVKIFKFSCMNLCTKVLLDKIPIDLRETKKVEITTAQRDQAKALGVPWDAELDIMHVSTSRQVASTLTTIFDLMGWNAPAVIPAKIILQQLWKLLLNWDKKPPDDLQEQWSILAKELTDYSVPRHLGVPHGMVIDSQLHGFEDASEFAYRGVDLSTNIVRGHHSSDKVSEGKDLSWSC